MKTDAKHSIASRLLPCGLSLGSGFACLGFFLVWPVEPRPIPLAALAVLGLTGAGCLLFVGRNRSADSVAEIRSLLREMWDSRFAQGGFHLGLGIVFLGASFAWPKEAMPITGLAVGACWLLTGFWLLFKDQHPTTSSELGERSRVG